MRHRKETSSPFAWRRTPDGVWLLHHKGKLVGSIYRLHPGEWRIAREGDAAYGFGNAKSLISAKKILTEAAEKWSAE